MAPQRQSIGTQLHTRSPLNSRNTQSAVPIPGDTLHRMEDSQAAWSGMTARVRRRPKSRWSPCDCHKTTDTAFALSTRAIQPFNGMPQSQWRSASSARPCSEACPQHISCLPPFWPAAYGMLATDALLRKAMHSKSGYKRCNWVRPMAAGTNSCPCRDTDPEMSSCNAQ